MQTQPPSQFPYQYPYGSTSEPSNGSIKTGFVVSLIAFILIILMLTVYYFILSPVGITHFMSLKNFYNYFIYIQAFFGLIGTIGFILGLIGTSSAVNRKTEFPHFQAAFSLAFGFVGVLVLIEFTLRILQVLFR